MWEGRESRMATIEKDRDLRASHNILLSGFRRKQLQRDCWMPCPVAAHQIPP